MLLGTKQQLAKVDINSITVGESVVNTKPVVRNLGSWFDSQLSMSTHISKLCSSAFFHLHNISRIRKFLSPVETKSLVHAFVTSRVDYCNSLLYGLPALQLVCCAPRFSHITPLMYGLHWLLHWLAGVIGAQESAFDVPFLTKKVLLSYTFY